MPVVAYQNPSFATMPFNSYELNPPIEKVVMLLTLVCRALLSVAIVDI